MPPGICGMTTLTRKTTLTAAALACALLAGCATTTDCGSDWYAIGARDGRLGAQPQAEYYASRCAAPVDRALYASGWQDGFAQRPTPGW